MKNYSWGFLIFCIISCTLCSATISNLEYSSEVKTSPLERANKNDSHVLKGLCKCPGFLNPADCGEVLKNGNTASGIYTIWPRSRVLKCKTLKVYCDMKTDGGGWTVIQRRGDFNNAEDFFNKNWNEYKTGFGNLKREFWIGNDNIFALTNQGSYAIRFDMRKRDGTTGYAQYNTFWIEYEEQNYRLHLQGYSGNAGDAMSPHHLKLFYTKDRANIQGIAFRWRKRHKGGWWYNVFPSSNLNGLNKKDNFHTQDGIVWNPFGGYKNSMAFTEIKVRSTSL